MSASRTKNSARNASVTIVSKLVSLVLSFICRTVFIEVLGAEYLGLNGLFSNILKVLSFAELGTGTAILYKMYKPIAEENKEKIKSLVHLYKKAYSIIGITIFVLGLALVPFLHFLIKDASGITENIQLLYILFLANSALSYFFTYKKSVISAHQNEHIVSLISLVAVVLTNITQIVFLLTTHNYTVYLLIQIVGTLFDNILASRMADKMYPYIKEKEYRKVSKREQKSFFKDVRSLFLYQLGFVLSSGTDNIIISSTIGVSQVGLLSNYTIITSAITGLLDSMFSSITASIGNLNTIKEKAKKEEVFYLIMFVLFVVWGYVSIMVALLINKFVMIWLGEDYVLGMSISIILGVDLFVSGMRYVNYTYRNTLGLFRKGSWVPFLAAVANIVLSFILVKPLGIFGVLLATPITRFSILVIYEAAMIHKNAFGTSPLRYYKTYGYYVLVLVLAFVASFLATQAIPLEGILSLIVDGVVITLIVVAIFWLFTFRTEQYREIKEKIKCLIGGVRRAGFRSR